MLTVFLATLATTLSVPPAGAGCSVLSAPAGVSAAACVSPVGVEYADVRVAGLTLLLI